MKKQIIILLLCFQTTLLIGQLKVLENNQPFDDVIKIDNSLFTNKKIVKLSLIYPNYSFKKNIVNLLTNKYGVFKNTQKFITWDLKNHDYLKNIKLDTLGNCSIDLKFINNTTPQSKENVLKEISKDLKRTLMLWQERKINNGEVYFVGHRGGLMDHFQENTSDILKYSKQAGISFMEVDILISNDDIPFIGHDWKYLETNLGINKQNDSLTISKARYKDGQKITFFSSLIASNQFLILDLIHNSIEEQHRIIQYIYKNYSKALKSHTYIQVDKLEMFQHIKDLDNQILVSYNVKRENTNNWEAGWIDKIKPKFNQMEMFVVNPSLIITKDFLEGFGEHAKKIIPVIYKDNTNEIIRMADLGFKFIMIDDIINVNHKLNEILLHK
ncbi:hypothetical protein JQC67_00085 [Aurantibacter crassamenti]|uniref:glycerophosphodiester phosphodiesterase family protein n=1 Tax=Aurantibacter crassamenti TaxID=1837375 RepID=UPI00193A8FED|nr:glycerophosphodiester phosphodiesterase family protein [Aurantibacter crassamenti]MBM1104522.1 hypothetical protein [Aurantibacter crassamenti]